MKDIWTLEAKQQVHRLRRSGFYPAEIALMIIPKRTKGSIDRLLSLEKKRGIIHDKLKPRHLKYDKKVIEGWREMKRRNPMLTYPQMSEVLNGVHPVVICRSLAKEAQGLLRY